MAATARKWRCVHTLTNRERLGATEPGAGYCWLAADNDGLYFCDGAHVSELDRKTGDVVRTFSHHEMKRPSEIAAGGASVLVLDLSCFVWVFAKTGELRTKIRLPFVPLSFAWWRGMIAVASPKAAIYVYSACGKVKGVLESEAVMIENMSADGDQLHMLQRCSNAVHTLSKEGKAQPKFDGRKHKVGIEFPVRHQEGWLFLTDGNDVMTYREKEGASVLRHDNQSCARANRLALAPNGDLYL